MLGGEAGGLDAGRRTYLVVGGAHMGIYGARAYVEFPGYLGVGHALGGEAKYLDLSGAKACRVGRCGRRLPWGSRACQDAVTANF